MRPYGCVPMGLLVLWSGLVSGTELSVEQLRLGRHQASGLAVVGGEVTLPGKGIWTLSSPDTAGGPLVEVSLQAPEAVYAAALGRRGNALEQERREREHRQALNSAYWPLAKWARTHGNRLPTRDELDENDLTSVERAFNSLAALPRQLLEVPDGPHAILVPGATFEFETPRWAGYEYVRATNTAPILVELHPLEDDGKHFVLRANGRLARVAIDPALMTRLGAEVLPLKLDPAAGSYPEQATYHLLARRMSVGDMRLSLTNRLTGASAALHCPAVDDGVPADEGLLKEWATRRAGLWEYAAGSYDAPGLRTWSWLQRAMLGGEQKPSDQNRQNRRNRRRGETTDMMGVLGGRAALRETLQLQALQLSEGSAVRSVPIERVTGVEVKSHPFEEMLAGRPGGRYAMAEVVPHDRFFVGISKPEALLPLLDEGAAFLARVGAGATGRALEYGLKQRYMEQLGVSEPMLRVLVEHHAIEEVALFSPDLFYADGTEVTAIVRMQGLAGITLLLKLMGVSALTDVPQAVKTANGGQAWWGMVADLIVVGTSRDEVRAALTLGRCGGAGSLGQSAEFRYMLTRVPPTPQTRAYVYFSDPFIRRLVGPEVKIGQVRRLQEKARLQTVAHAAMLRAYLGGGEATHIEQLVDSGCLPQKVVRNGVTLDADGIPLSATYGPLPRMASLYASDLSTLTTNEVAAYSSYKEEYTRYWRRFFDPVAICVDEAGDELVATTYILPLLDNSLYEGVRQLVNSDPAVPLRIPQVTPQPTAMLSFNLSEKAWQEMLRDGYFKMMTQLGIRGGALDTLGPAFHFAVFDAEPIIAFGSRSMLGMGGQFGDFDDEMAIPLLISLLTRPCAMLVELQDPDAIRALFTDGSLKALLRRWDHDVELTSYRIVGRDCWVAGLDFWGLSLRFSFSIEDHYLVIGNMPWREAIHVTEGASAVVSGAAIQVNPSAARIEQRALQLAAMEGQGEAVMEGLAYLYPLLAAGVSPAEAVERHRALFGFAPALPEDGALEWNGHVPGYRGFGTLLSREQPPFDPETVFGALQGVGNASASMQLEDSGLRTIVRWRWRK